MSDQARREEVRFRSGELTLAGTFAVPGGRRARGGRADAARLGAALDRGYGLVSWRLAAGRALGGTRRACGRASK